jgi:UPF0755 protein
MRFSRVAASEFLVAPGSNVKQVIENLRQNKLIRSTAALRLIVGQQTIQAGSYLLSPQMSGWQIAALLTSGHSQQVIVLVPEGTTNRQLEALLEKDGLTQNGGFIQALKQIKTADFPWLPAKALSYNFEGFLFPDTYYFTPKSTPQEMAAKMLNNFKRHLDAIDSEVKSSSLSLEKIIILASLVEKEGKTDTDMRHIASVLLNRLKIGMRLDIDATVRYALNKWEGSLTAADLASSSPYNTRKVLGLPPGPICNPGLQAIKAVLEAPSTDYLYYLTDNRGVTHFAKTLTEHNQQVTQYLK